MRQIRVLVIDDAVVVRRLLAGVLSSDPELQVVGTAANGRIGLAKIPQVNPDVVTLDIEMPEMDGLETLAAIRRVYKTLPVIVFSTLTERGARVTLDALTLGATDYVTKPANVGSVASGVERIRDELIPKIKGLCGHAVGLPEERVLAPARSVRLSPGKPRIVSRRVDIVAIGVSTGGPSALGALLPELPHDFPVPIVIVQHMPPVFTRLLAERLCANAAIQVSEGAAGSVLKPGHAWIAPGGHHMVVARDGAGIHLELHDGPPENSCRPAVDVLFRSVAALYGSRTLGVILTGMGQDGLRGCEHIWERGGQIIVQDEASSVVWGMPGFVARAGLADRVLALDQLGQEITRRVMAGRLTWRPDSAGAATQRK